MHQRTTKDYARLGTSFQREFCFLCLLLWSSPGRFTNHSPPFIIILISVLQIKSNGGGISRKKIKIMFNKDSRTLTSKIDFTEIYSLGQIMTWPNNQISSGNLWFRAVVKADLVFSYKLRIYTWPFEPNNLATCRAINRSVYLKWRSDISFN